MGKALEELRGTLHNDLRTSEGAKRQQQRFCGPPVALTFNFIVAVGIIMANKLVLGKIGFDFPVCLTLIHYATSWFLLAIFKAFSLLPVSPASRSTPFSSLFALGAVMALSTGFANISLLHNSVGFYQMAKIAVTPTIVLAEFILFRKIVSFSKVGVAVATVDVEDDTSDHLFLVSFDAMYGPTWRVVLQLGLEEYISYPYFSFIWLSSSMVWSFSTWMTDQQYQSDGCGCTVSETPEWHKRFTEVLLCPSRWATFCACEICKLVDPFAYPLSVTSYVRIPMLLILCHSERAVQRYLFFNSDPGVVSIFGATVALCGMSAYTALNLKKSETDGLQLPEQSPPLPKQKAAVNISEKKSDAKNTEDLAPSPNQVKRKFN
ncbi:hypothetical protein ACLOJK_016006 [Asimina triloba]